MAMFQQAKVLDAEKVLDILENTEIQGIDRLPKRPKGGEVFLVQGKNVNDAWKKDSYTWSCEGVRKIKLEEKLIIKRHLYLLWGYELDDMGMNKRKIKQGFKKHVYNLDTDPSRVVVHFLGNEKMADGQPSKSLWKGKMSTRKKKLVKRDKPQDGVDQGRADEQPCQSSATPSKKNRVELEETEQTQPVSFTLETDSADSTCVVVRYVRNELEELAKQQGGGSCSSSSSSEKEKKTVQYRVKTEPVQYRVETDGPSILVIQMGGTIDKDYPKRNGGYAFEIGYPAAKTLLTSIQPSVHFEYQTVCQKDSQEITDQDRQLLYEVCKSTPHTKILITHGTDTMIETAAYLAKKQLSKTILLTGSFLPATFKKTDADFNIGVAVGALQCTSFYNVFVAMNGCVRLWNAVEKCSDTGKFIAKL